MKLTKMTDFAGACGSISESFAHQAGLDAQNAKNRYDGILGTFDNDVPHIIS